MIYPHSLFALAAQIRFPPSPPSTRTKVSSMPWRALDILNSLFTNSPFESPDDLLYQHDMKPVEDHHGVASLRGPNVDHVVTLRPKTRHAVSFWPWDRGPSKVFPTPVTFTRWDPIGKRAIPSVGPYPKQKVKDPLAQPEAPKTEEEEALEEEAETEEVEERGGADDGALAEASKPDAPPPPALDEGPSEEEKKAARLEADPFRGDTFEEAMEKCLKVLNERRGWFSPAVTEQDCSMLPCPDNRAGVPEKVFCLLEMDLDVQHTRVDFLDVAPSKP